MQFSDLSKRDQDALAAMVGATRAKPILPRAYLFRRDAADHLVKLGLASFRGFDGVSSGGYWQTDKGWGVFRPHMTLKPLTVAQKRVLKSISEKQSVSGHSEQIVANRLQDRGFIARGRCSVAFDKVFTFYEITQAGTFALHEFC